MRWRAVALCSAVILWIVGAAAADRAARSDFRVDSSLVLIPVSVTDHKNHAVTGLPPEAFRIFEGKMEQMLAQFASQDVPVSIGIVFDSSGSMQGKLNQTREAVARFLSLANPEDEFFLVDFNTTAQLTVPFTYDAGAIQNQLLLVRPNGKTALLDAVSVAIETMKDAANARRALLILSDGGDNLSRFTESEIRRRVRESDLSIYSIGIDDRGGIMLPEANRGDALLTSLSEESGGHYFSVPRLSELPEIAARIGLELRNQYVLGYRPANLMHDGGYHRVQIKMVAGRDLRVISRPGYYDRE